MGYVSHMYIVSHLCILCLTYHSHMYIVSHLCILCLTYYFQSQMHTLCNPYITHIPHITFVSYFAHMITHIAFDSPFLTVPSSDSSPVASMGCVSHMYIVSHLCILCLTYHFQSQMHTLCHPYITYIPHITFVSYFAHTITHIAFDSRF